MRNGVYEEKLLLGIKLTFLYHFSIETCSLRLCDRGSKDVGVTGIDDGHGGATEELTGGGTELNAVREDLLASVLLSKALIGRYV